MVCIINNKRFKTYFLCIESYYVNIFRYPFDIQKCPIQVDRIAEFYNQFVMKWSDPPKIQKMILTQYNALQYLEYDNDT